MAETVLTALVVVAIGIILIGDSSARELRPSDHGLVFQTLSPTGAKSSPEMRSFFNSDSQNSSSLSSSTTSSSNVAIPRAMNSPAAPPSWLREASAAVGPNGGDRVSKALMAASVVCGTVGAVLLLASGLVYLLKYRTKQKQNAASFGEGVDRNNHVENDDENNKLQLVVCEP
ncbi:hypothetical protein PIB30_052294 [Stylosanthes scabra]|uniref:Transmembrane protein n=1 Tax=Stylosanthes scabra TaxID=79078 RepID=A0ABU6RI64_9FABA|nr:hypothetical protein [Stylosanthes scabra]